MPELPDREARDVEEYVNSQTSDRTDTVKLVQKVGSRRAAHSSFDLYDVWTEKGSRWWVITDPLNLYSQSDFNSIDQAFTYHLGVRTLVYDDRPMAGFDAPEEKPEESEPALPVAPLRTYQRAVLAMGEAVEAEDFQAVGIRCRETLLAFARYVSTAEWIPPQEQPPKRADFKGWMDIYANAVATGKQRAYLKAVADKTWDLAVWLQHYTDAMQWDAEIVLNATRHFLTSFALAYRCFSEGSPARCPQCDSYRLRVDEDTAEQGGQLGWLSRPVCAGCGWHGPEEFEPFPQDYLRRLDAYIQAVRAEESEDQAS